MLLINKCSGPAGSARWRGKALRVMLRLLKVVWSGLSDQSQAAGKQAHQTLGLSQGLTKYQAKHQACLDGLIQIDGLPAWCAARLGWAGLHRLRGNPKRQAATVAKS
jgi:hypothetical protein